MEGNFGAIRLKRHSKIEMTINACTKNTNKQIFLD